MPEALTLAVYHRSRDVLRVLAPLRRAGRLRVACFEQSASVRVPARATGVLWELGVTASGEPNVDRRDRRALSRVLASVPAASFGAGARPISDLSRALGFRHHLRVPLRLAEVERAVKQARAHCDDVEFSAEDATRSDWDYLVQVFTLAIQAGATTLNVPDTVGYTTPDEYGALIRHLRERVPGSDRVVFSVHCHNDLGLAVANSLAAVRAGARQIECTINGIGERAGNTSLEEVVMAIKTRRDVYAGLDTGIVTTEIYPASRLLSSIIGVSVQPNKAIVGDNAFAHEAGIHQDGVLKAAITYEIMTPQSIGRASNELVLGKHSGRHAFRDRLGELGFQLEPEDFERAFVRGGVVSSDFKTENLGYSVEAGLRF